MQILGKAPGFVYLEVAAAGVMDEVGHRLLTAQGLTASVARRARDTLETGLWGFLNVKLSISNCLRPQACTGLDPSRQ